MMNRTFSQLTRVAFCNFGPPRAISKAKAMMAVLRRSLLARPHHHVLPLTFTLGPVLAGQRTCSHWIGLDCIWLSFSRLVAATRGTGVQQSGTYPRRRTKAEAKTEAKGRALLAGRRVPKWRTHNSPKLARGDLCMAALQ